MEDVETRYIASFRKRCVIEGIARMKSEGCSWLNAGVSIRLPFTLYPSSDRCRIE